MRDSLTFGTGLHAVQPSGTIIFTPAGAGATEVGEMPKGSRDRATKMSGVGSVLKRLRTGAGMSLNDAAVACNTDKGLISRYENDKVPAPESYIAALAK